MPKNSAVGVALFAAVPLGALGALIGGAGVARAAGIVATPSLERRSSWQEELGMDALEK